MPTIEVVSEFRFSPDGRETITYEPGTHEGVTELCAQYALRKGYLAGGMPLADIAGADIFPQADANPLPGAAHKKAAKAKPKSKSAPQPL